MGEKMQSPSSSSKLEEASSSSSSQAFFFNGCCARPSFLNLHNNYESSYHSLKTTTNIVSSSQYNFIVSTLCSLHPNISHFTNHEALPSLQESFTYFTKSYPQFSLTQQADDIRSREYHHLALSSLVCLDYVGIGIFSCPSKEQDNDSNVSKLFSPSSSRNSGLDFSEPDFFNVHHKMVSLKSQLLCGIQQSEAFEIKMRKMIMDFMNVYEEDYTMVFTSNQTSAFKVLSDSYPFHSHRNLLTVYDYNNEGIEIMVESSKKRGARVLSAEFSWPSMKIQSRKLRKIITSTNSTSSGGSTSIKKINKKKINKGLFVFPLQSRMSGSRYSYQWMSVARENGWHVLLDACALGPKDMETLGLSLFKPDFLVCSFYKVFGENPSGFGCLFVKKSTISTLIEPTTSTSIGIVSLVPPPPPPSDLEEDNNIHVDQKSTLVDESSTTIIDCSGLDQADSLGLITISTRSRCLINWLVNALTKLRHPNSETNRIINPLIRIYGPNIGFDRGPSLAFNVFDWKGEKVDPILVQKLADRNNISLSYGFLEQVGFVDKNEEDKERRIETSVITRTCSDNHDHDKYGICAITLTLGIVSNFEDVYKVWSFVARFLDADFLEKERWRYLALNQTTIEV